MLHLNELWPFPAEAALAGLKGAVRVLTVENNATGQFSRIIRAATGFEFKAWIHKYDGRPFTVEELIGEIHGQLGNV